MLEETVAHTTRIYQSGKLDIGNMHGDPQQTGRRYDKVGFARESSGVFHILPLSISYFSPTLPRSYPKEKENMPEEKTLTKIKDLTPNSKQVNILAKVVSVGTPKDVMGRYGESKKVAEAIVGDDSAVVTLSLWNEQIGKIAKDEIVLVDNGYVSLVRGHMRLNVGRYGNLNKSQEAMASVNTSVDMSAQEFLTERRGYGGGGGGGYGRGGDDRGGDRDRPRRF
jgi:replication factor A1